MTDKLIGKTIKINDVYTAEVRGFGNGAKLTSRKEYIGRTVLVVLDYSIVEGLQEVKPKVKTESQINIKQIEKYIRGLDLTFEFSKIMTIKDCVFDRMRDKRVFSRTQEIIKDIVVLPREDIRFIYDSCRSLLEDV